MDASEAAAFWDERYRSLETVWPLKANALLREFAADLAPGSALDVGAGEGRNAIWLADRGWRVTALDVSKVALERAARRAADHGVELECVRTDWREYDPPEPVDLAVISFMHPAAEERAKMFARFAAALRPGGHIFTIGVALAEQGRRGPPDADRLYTPERLRAALAGLELLRCEQLTYVGDGRDGPKRVTDVVAIARRPVRDPAGPLTEARGTPAP